jgi:F-type H+-transporting ATPase subunit b
LAEKEQIISDAREKASLEAHKQMEEATRRIAEEKDKAIREIRTEIADLSVAIAEKVMKEKISRTDEQEKIINGLLDEISFSKS